ncbi:MAG: molybdate ABC transporter substrate-binding protein, partial [Chloroflexota bacterium]
VGCGVNSPEPITVFAASSLTDAFEEMAQAFETEHGEIDVLLNFAGSSQLAVQRREGASADLFASAHEAQFEAVVAEGLVASEGPVVFATNRLTIVTSLENEGEINQLEDLSRPGIDLILALEGVPIRTYTNDIVSRLPAATQRAFYANLVSEEDNVRRVAAKVALGEADAGIVYISDLTPDLRNQLNQVEIPESQNALATYPIGRLANAPQPEAADAFIDFVLSPAGQEILARSGFGPAEGSDGVTE